MPAPRKPTRVLELAGRFRKNPDRGRARADEPVDNAPMGGPPDYLGATAREVWRELQGRLVPGVALASDQDAFELLVRLVAALRDGGLGSLQVGHIAQMNKLYTQFGMTPADRSRVKAPPKPKAGNPFANKAG